MSVLPASCDLMADVLGHLHSLELLLYTSTRAPKLPPQVGQRLVLACTKDAPRRSGSPLTVCRAVPAGADAHHHAPLCRGRLPRASLCRPQHRCGCKNFCVAALAVPSKACTRSRARCAAAPLAQISHVLGAETPEPPCASDAPAVSFLKSVERLGGLRMAALRANRTRQVPLCAPLLAAPSVCTLA